MEQEITEKTETEELVSRKRRQILISSE